MKNYRVIINTWQNCDRCKNVVSLLNNAGIAFEINECEKNSYLCESLEQILECYHYPMIQVSEKVYTSGIYVEHSTVFHLSNLIAESKPKKINKKVTSVPSITINELVSKAIDFIKQKNTL